MGERVVVLGSLNMDIVVSAARKPEVGETVLGESVRYVPGGKGANQAIGLKQLDADKKMLGVIGDDIFGEKIMQQLHQLTIDRQHIKQVNGTATGIATIIHTPKDNSIIVVPGANTACTTAYVDEVEAVIASADVLLMQFEIPLETVKYALQLAKKNNVTTIVNPAPAQELTEDLLRYIDYITPNQSELAVLLDNANEDLETIFKQWNRKHTTELIVTLGEKGCAYWDGENVIKIAAKQLGEVRDTTGAGDAFNAGLAYGISKRWTIRQSVLLANTVSGLAVTKFGAQAGMPTKQDVNRFWINKL
ncbi:ribokinase [Paraliobacillus zengyii]|uniref:ribokinase n=1 Tax=Paraliobacillus zengyii TaxID=2213194 RepID=UPI000DD413DB|nr:ribokinase [Paraliobacillus zengyii]